MFRPHYMGWSEQQKIEFNAPEYLKNLIQIVTETGLRIYKELAPIRKEHLDLLNGTVWIPDSKTVNGVAEVPLTDIAIEAFRRQLAISGPGPFLFPSEEDPDETSEDVQDDLARHVASGGCSILSDLRPEIYIRHTAERWRSCRRIRNAAPEAGGREGLQEVLSDEAANEAGGPGQVEPERQRRREEF